MKMPNDQAEFDACEERAHVVYARSREWMNETFKAENPLDVLVAHLMMAADLTINIQRTGVPVDISRLASSLLNGYITSLKQTTGN